MLLDHEQVEVLSAVLFTLLAFGHVVRLGMGWSMQLGPYGVPMYVSGLAVLVTGYLAYEFWRKVLNEL